MWLYFLLCNVSLSLPIQMMVLLPVSPAMRATGSWVAYVIPSVSLASMLSHRWLIVYMLCVCHYSTNLSHLPHENKAIAAVCKASMFVMEQLLCNKLFCCLRALTRRVMSQSAKRVIRPALTAVVPACGTALCAPRSSSCLMMAAACPAVEMRHASMINQYPGSAVTARPHQVKTRTHSEPQTSSKAHTGHYIETCFLKNNVYVCVNH